MSKFTYFIVGIIIGYFLIQVAQTFVVAHRITSCYDKNMTYLSGQCVQRISKE